MADLGAIGTAPPRAKNLYTHSVSGVVEDVNGDPTRHSLRAFHRTSGALVGATFSDPTTGNYVIYTNIKYGDDEVTVIDYDNGYDNNARVIDRVIPL